MADLTSRIESLSPEQRRLLEERLRQRGQKAAATPAPQPAPLSPLQTSPATPARPMDFSLSFFSADGTGSGEDRYRLLRECAAFADRRGFAAVWTPERHFQAFGGLYPNPAVLSAALAVATQRLRIRAGSVVLPLHSPVRVAEDWALVDNLSGGRVDVSFATGWHAHDYVIAPENYAERRRLMFETIPLVQRLWAGEEVEIPGVDGRPTPVRTLPRPIQPRLPVWITASSPHTWADAGAIGANVLSSYIGGTLEQLAENVRSYREARRVHGHDPRKGVVSLMLHTCLGRDEEAVREKVRAPLKQYLSHFINQFRPLLQGELAAEGGEEMESLLELAFERYYDHSSLLGTPEKCSALIERLSAIGVDEAACLVDFGVDLATTLESLELLDALRRVREERLAQGRGT